MTEEQERDLLVGFLPWLRVTAANMTTPDQSADLAQEGWIAMWRALPSYDESRPAGPWFKTAARHAMYNVIRNSHAAQRDVRRELNCWDVTEVMDVGWEHPGLDVAYHRAEIKQAIDELTDHQRQYVTARFWLDMSYSELNDHFNTKNSNSLWRQRIRPKLEKSLSHLAD